VTIIAAVFPADATPETHHAKAFVRVFGRVSAGRAESGRSLTVTTLQTQNDGESVSETEHWLTPGAPEPRAEFAFMVVHEGSRGTVAWVQGDLDVATAPVLLRRLIDVLSLPLETLVVDLALVRDVDSHGLAALRAATKRATMLGVDLSFDRVPNEATRMALEQPSTTDEWPRRDAGIRSGR
jgi:anti-anti-sigma regulatory factor